MGWAARVTKMEERTKIGFLEARGKPACRQAANLFNLFLSQPEARASQSGIFIFEMLQ